MSTTCSRSLPAFCRLAACTQPMLATKCSLKTLFYPYWALPIPQLGNLDPGLAICLLVSLFGGTAALLVPNLHKHHATLRAWRSPYRRPRWTTLNALEAYCNTGGARPNDQFLGHRQQSYFVWWPEHTPSGSSMPLGHPPPQAGPLLPRIARPAPARARNVASVPEYALTLARYPHPHPGPARHPLLSQCQPGLLSLTLGLSRCYPSPLGCDHPLSPHPPPLRTPARPRFLDTYPAMYSCIAGEPAPVARHSSILFLRVHPNLTYVHPFRKPLAYLACMFSLFRHTHLRCALDLSFFGCTLLFPYRTLVLRASCDIFAHPNSVMPFHFLTVPTYPSVLQVFPLGPRQLNLTLVLLISNHYLS
ncbi:hypothetical protein C8R45DRAFT_1160651 [Mycena sanguinolenta]|nr:hypothetical protein C8R45DRAFT_1160651 [Mycena sanguinolenta]